MSLEEKDEDGLHFVFGKSEQFEEVLSFLLSHFYGEEPISRAAGMTVADARTFFPVSFGFSFRFLLCHVQYFRKR